MTTSQELERGRDLLRQAGVIAQRPAPQLTEEDMDDFGRLCAAWPMKPGDPNPVMEPLVRLARSKLGEWIEAGVDFAAVRQALIESFTPGPGSDGSHQMIARDLTARREPLGTGRRTLITDTLARWLWGERRQLSEHERLHGDPLYAGQLYNFTRDAAWEVAVTAVQLETQARSRS